MRAPNPLAQSSIVMHMEGARMRLRRSLIGLPVLLVLAALLAGSVPAAAARKVALGVSIEEGWRDQSTFQTFTNKVGGNKPRIWTLWSKWGSRDGHADCQSGAGTCSFPTNEANWVRDQGAVPMIFWEPLVSVDNCMFAEFRKVAKGDYDDYIEGWAQAAKAYGGKVILRYAQEINGAYFPWGLKNKKLDCGNTISDFKDAWRHVYGVFQDQGATNVKFLWSVSRRSCKGRGCNPFKAYYPGNATVDYVGFSSFNWGRHSGHRWESMPYLVGTVMPYFKQFTSKPVIIAEIATNKKGGNKPAWIRDGYDKVYKRWTSIKGIVYLNVDLSGIGHPDWSLKTPNPGAYNAYANVASKAKFKGTL